MKLIDKVFIRAKVAERWGSYSIEELYDMEQLGTIKYWFIDTILKKLDLIEGQKPKKESIEKGLHILRNIK